MKTQMFNVLGWLNGSDYDAGKPASVSVSVRATSESEAEDKGDRKIAKEFGACDVVIAQSV